MYCNKCGTYLNNDVKFCSKCGNKVAQKEQEANNENEKSCEEIAYQLKNDGFILISDTDKGQEWKNFDTAKIIEVEKLDNGKCKIKNGQNFSHSNTKQENTSQPKNNSKMKIIIGVIVALILGIMAWQQVREKQGKEEYDLGLKAENSKDFELAAKHYGKACEYGNAGGCTNIGYAYSQGLGVASNYDKAFEYSKEACDGEDAQGCTNLGVAYEFGRGVDKNVTKANELYRNGCDLNCGQGCQNLGNQYINGTSVEKDYKKAIELYEKGCTLDEEFCAGLAFAYKKGYGVQQDYGKSVTYYEKSCNKGDYESCDELGYLYETIANDYENAVKYYAKACDGGNALGCTEFAQMFEHGKGVTKNISTAMKFYKQGCDSGNDWGCKQLDRLNSAAAVPSE